MLALDVVRLEAGLVLLEVDYTSARHALNPEQNYSPYELGMGRLVDLEAGDFVGRLYSSASRLGAGRRDGWSGSSSTGTGSSPPSRARACPRRSPPPSIARRCRCSPAAAIGRSGRSRATAGARSSSRPSGWRPCRRPSEAPGTRLAVEWTVEGHRGRVDATVVPLPFLDLPQARLTS